MKVVTMTLYVNATSCIVGYIERGPISGSLFVSPLGLCVRTILVRTRRSCYYKGLTTTTLVLSLNWLLIQGYKSKAAKAASDIENPETYRKVPLQ